MRLFLKEQISLVMVQCIQFAAFFLILWLSGFHDYIIIIYGFLIGLFFLSCYLSFHYYKRRHVYRKLSHPPKNLEELLEVTDSVPIGEAIDRLNKTQYKLFMNKLKTAEDDQAEHLKFMDRWVHQMKTPLSVIELTAQHLDEPELSSMREETDRLKNGLHTVLNVARLRTIQEDFHIKPVGLEKIMHQVNQENKRFYIRNEVYPHLHVNEKLTVETDEKWFLFIMNQLVQNAVKYSTGKSNRVDISLYKKEEAAIIEVTDYGVGIPEQDKKRIFQAFFTGSNGRLYRESTGMGLYLTKEAADYLGHTIEVESTVNYGTTFRIRFTNAQILQK